ncbi:MAG: hypothetical protein WC531_01455 [Candidatus Paceibacterota bacterium]
MEQMEFSELVPEEERGDSTQAESALDLVKERDCPVCGGSGVCSSCERGRAQAKEFEEANKREREGRKKKGRKNRWEKSHLNNYFKNKTP